MPSNRLLGVDDTADANATQLYEYDVEDRLTSADVGAWNSPVLFSYDSVGNRTAISDGQNGDSWQYGYGLTHNRLNFQKAVLNGVAGTELNVTYDAMGNLVNDRIGLQLSYNATGRLVQASKGPQSMNAVYNAMGQRVIKTSGSSVRVYAVDEVGRPLGVYIVDSSVASGYKVEEEYIHLDGWRPVAVIRPDTSTGMNTPHVFPILSDHLGTPRKVLDGKNGQVRWTWDAKQPFGHELPNETPTAGLDPFVFDLRFSGQRYDEETGLFQNGFRDYHPGLGRYVQSDPIGLDGGWNTYSYVSGSPLMNTDSSGLVIDGKAFNIPEFREALAYLSQSPSGREIIQRVVDAKQVMFLVKNSEMETYFTPKFSTFSKNFISGRINWDPYMGLYNFGNTESCQNGLSPAMNLIHEMIHFLQALNPDKYEIMEKESILNGTPYTREFYSTLENDAVIKERKVAKELREMDRQLYNNVNVKRVRFNSVKSSKLGE